MIENSSFLLGLGGGGVVSIWKSRPSFCMTISLALSLSHQAGRPAGPDNFSLSLIRLNCTATAASERNEGTKYFFRVWTVQQNALVHSKIRIKVCTGDHICCTWKLLFVFLSSSKCLRALGGRQTNHPTFLSFFANKRFALWKRWRRTTIYGIEAVLWGESDFWGPNRCWPVIDFS